MLRTLPLAVLLLLLAGTAGAHISDVAVFPSEPLDGEIIFVTVSGWLSDGCWSYGHGEVAVVGSEITIDLYAADSWSSGGSCPTVVIPYEDYFEFGPLTPGTYLLRVIEHHDSLRYPEPEISEHEIVVESSVPAEPTRWSSIKGLYRE